MKHSISRNSFGLQADRDINVNIGLAIDEVEKLTILFLQQNFPKLREDAMQEAKDNMNLFLKEFEQRLKNEFEKINPEFFSDPDVQFSINEAVIEAAKRGAKSNLDLLADLVVKRAYSTQTDLQSLALAEAIKIVARLTNEQINLICIEFFITKMEMPVFHSFQDYDKSCFQLLELTNGLDTLTGWNIQYLEYQKCADHHFITGLTDIIKLFQKKYPTILSGLKPEEIREQMNSTNYFKTFVDIYEKHNLNDLHLTIIGQLIAAVKIAQYLPGSVDFADYIK